ncbi:hypothetical protein C8R46DRAFT_1043444 [Mycena filopes]|nr:hypothetical protein C8R46DRAFT_1043444 [Mycena filopes]
MCREKSCSNAAVWSQCRMSRTNLPQAIAKVPHAKSTTAAACSTIAAAKCQKCRLQVPQIAAADYLPLFGCRRVPLQVRPYQRFEAGWKLPLHAAAALLRQNPFAREERPLICSADVKECRPNDDQCSMSIFRVGLTAEGKADDSGSFDGTIHQVSENVAEGEDRLGNSYSGAGMRVEVRKLVEHEAEEGVARIDETSNGKQISPCMIIVVQERE